MHGSTKLKALLSNQLKLLEAVEQALNQEHDALIGDDPEVLQQAANEKSRAVAAYQEASGALSAWMAENRVSDAASLEVHVRGLNDPNLLSTHQRLKELSLHCEECNKRNGTLILRLQEKTGKLLGILRGGDAFEGLYSVTGSKEGDAPGRTLGKA
ncbi:MAG: flagellar protein FlgN [Pseudomonadota bacterium]